MDKAKQKKEKVDTVVFTSRLPVQLREELDHYVKTKNAAKRRSGETQISLNDLVVRWVDAGWKLHRAKYVDKDGNLIQPKTPSKKSGRRNGPRK
jgi:hypothetical protein